MFLRFATRSHQFDSDNGSDLHESANGRLTVSKTVNLGPTPSSCATQGNLQQSLKNLKTVGRWFESNHSF